MTNIFFLKCFIINFVVNFMYRMFNEKSINENFSLQEIYNNTVKPLNSGHLWVLKNVSVIERCLLLGGNLKKIVTFGAKHFVRYSRHVRCLRFSLLGGFTVKKKKTKVKILWLLACNKLHTWTDLSVGLRMRLRLHASQGTVWFTVFRLLENAFVKLSLPHGMI